MPGLRRSRQADEPAGQEHQFSHWLSKVLRHRAKEWNIAIDSHGWAQVHEVLRPFPRICPFDPALLAGVVETSLHSDGQPRFQLRESHGQSWIRALRHHSIGDVHLGQGPSHSSPRGPGPAPPCATQHRSTMTATRLGTSSSSEKVRGSLIEASTGKLCRSSAKELQSLSRFVVKILRHRATEVGLHVKGDGWVRLQDVLGHIIDGFVHLFPNASLGALKEVVASSRRNYDRTPRFQVGMFDGVEWIKATERSTLPSSSTSAFTKVVQDSTSDCSGHDSSPSGAALYHEENTVEFVGDLGKALADFDGSDYQTSDDYYLSFSKDTPLILERSEGAWSFGKIHDKGDKGWFPTEFWKRFDTRSSLDDFDVDITDSISLASFPRDAINLIKIRSEKHLSTTLDAELHLWPIESEDSSVFQVTKDIVLTMWRYVEHAQGGALAVIAPKTTLRQLDWSTTDGGYMTRKMEQLQVGDVDYAKAFNEFTRHGDGDRWPSQHEDQKARGLPKDGAILVHTSRARTITKAAVKILGLKAPCDWPRTGNRHETAGAVAEFLEHGIIIVRSSGSEDASVEANVHVLLASDNGRKAYLL